MLLTGLVYSLLFVPGFALSRRLWPVLGEGGLLGVIAGAYLSSLLLLAPISMLCYALSAPLWVFSAALCALGLLGAIALYLGRADRELLALLRREPIGGWILLVLLLWLQLRIGGYFEGDATFHLGRVRVLVQHGFTNRDIYLADEHFYRIYHTNLLYPLYASLSQLSGQSYLALWFHSQLWAKLLVASGHFVLGHAVTRKPGAGFALALAAITANAGEAYTVYPNTLAVGWLVPLALGAGYALLARDGPRGLAGVVAASSFVMGQVHALYALYAGLVLAPSLLLLGAGAHWRGGRIRVLLALLGLFAGAPFLLVSQYGWPPGPEWLAASSAGGASSADGSAEARAAPPPAGARPLPDVKKGQPLVPTQAVALGGGHLEKTLELDPDTAQVRFAPEKLGGRSFVALGFAGFLLAFALNRERRGPLCGAALSALLLAAGLFSPRWATLALEQLQQPFTVARLSTLLSSLLLLGCASALAELGARVPVLGRWGVSSSGAAPTGFLRAAAQALALALVVGLSSRLTGHAPVFFADVVRSALAPREVRQAALERLEARRALLAELVPAGSTVLATGRFARYVVMLCDCYVIAADRGHSRLDFIRERREHLVRLNAPDTPWPEREALLRRYRLQLVVFESRHLNRLYRWTHEHGRVLGASAGLEVVRLN